MRKTVNVGDVVADGRYLTAFGTTKSEIIVPVLDGGGENVVGTIDVESEKPNRFRKRCRRFSKPAPRSSGHFGAADFGAPVRGGAPGRVAK